LKIGGRAVSVMSAYQAGGANLSINYTTGNSQLVCFFSSSLGGNSATGAMSFELYSGGSLIYSNTAAGPGATYGAYTTGVAQLGLGPGTYTFQVNTSESTPPELVIFETFH
jgi:hypothetical protein